MKTKLFRRSNRPVRKGQEGMILIAATLMLVALMAAALVAVRRTTITSDHVRRDYQDEKVFQIADGGADVAEAWLHDLLKVTPNPSQAQLNVAEPPDVTNYNFVEYSITKNAFRHDAKITQGPYAGLTAQIQPYTIRSHAANWNSTDESTVEVTVNQFWVNLFQYAIYYDGDLELFPRNPSTFTGRIHSNGSVYLGSNSVFDIVGSVTCAGHIYNTPKDPTISFNGKARIADRQLRWHDLDYDWRDPDWVELSLDDWEGLVEDSSHGITAQPYPIASLPEPIDIIKRAEFGDDSLHHALRLYYRAGLKILDGVATDSMGFPITIPAGIVTSESVKDWREGHNMEMRTYDMAQMIAQGLIPANGIIYISYTHGDAAVRIKNAATLPAGGLIIGTDNPCYVQGDFNTINKQPSSVFCDAFNFYSNAWQDARANSNLNMRNATPTRLNTCIVAGNKPTTPGHYSGGAANLIRLHERWSASDELTYRGSLVCIWASEQATGDFVNGAPVFSEFHRDSGYDPDLLDPAFWPDEALLENNISRASWRFF